MKHHESHGIERMDSFNNHIMGNKAWVRTTNYQSYLNHFRDVKGMFL